MPSRVSVAILRFNCVFFLAASHVKSSEPDYLFPDTEQGLCFHAKESYSCVHILFTTVRLCSLKELVRYAKRFRRAVSCSKVHVSVYGVLNFIQSHSIKAHLTL